MLQYHRKHNIAQNSVLRKTYRITWSKYEVIKYGLPGVSLWVKFNFKNSLSYKLLKYSWRWNSPANKFSSKKMNSSPLLEYWTRHSNCSKHKNLSTHPTRQAESELRLRRSEGTSLYPSTCYLYPQNLLLMKMKPIHIPEMKKKIEWLG